MTDDIVDQLRLAAKPEEWASVWGLTVARCSMLRAAADEIERLRALVAELAAASAALREAAEHQNGCVGNPDWRTAGTDCPCGMFSVFARYDNVLRWAIGDERD